jgi:hypothetical protein
MNALIDKTILAQSGQHLVLEESAAVTFLDASTLFLHRVEIASGLPAIYLRAVQTIDNHGAACFLVFDVRDVGPGLRQSLKPAPTRDVQGLIYYALRQSYDDSLICMSAIHDQQLDSIELTTQGAPA